MQSFVFPVSVNWLNSLRWNLSENKFQVLLLLLVSAAEMPCCCTSKLHFIFIYFPTPLHLIVCSTRTYLLPNMPGEFLSVEAGMVQAEFGSPVRILEARRRCGNIWLQGTKFFCAQVPPALLRPAAAAAAAREATLEFVCFQFSFYSLQTKIL